MGRVSSAGRQRALFLDKKRELVTRKGVTRSKQIGTTAARMAFQQAKQGNNVFPEALEFIRREMTTLLISGMVAANLVGRRTVRAAARSERKVLKLQIEEPFADQVEHLQAEMNLSDFDIEVLEEEFGRAATTQVLEVLGGLQGHLRQAQNNPELAGANVSTAANAIQQAFRTAGVTSENPYLLNTIWRTNLQFAFTAGRLAEAQNPLIQDILWGWQYVTVGDGRVRPSHSALDGWRAQKNDPHWNTVMPPNGWNCRCTFIEVFNDERPPGGESNDFPPTEEDEDGDLIVPGPEDAQFAFNPGNVFFDNVATSSPLFSPLRPTPISLPFELKGDVSGLLGQLNTPGLEAKQKKKIRGALRRLGHTGGTRGVRQAIAPRPKPKLKVPKPEPIPTKISKPPKGKDFDGEELRTKFNKDFKVQAEEHRRLTKAIDERTAKFEKDWDAAKGKDEQQKIWDKSHKDLTELRNELKPIDSNLKNRIHKSLEVSNPAKTDIIFDQDPSERGRSKKGFSTRAQQEITASVDQVASWTDKSRVRVIRADVQKIRANGRDFFDPDDRTLNIGEIDRGTIQHELMHSVEWDSARLSSSSKQFLKRRTRGEKAQRLRDITEYDFDPSEEALADEFKDPYVGKVYPKIRGKTGTEVMSMGVEQLQRNPVKFMQEDPDYFDFVVNSLRGKL